MKRATLWLFVGLIDMGNGADLEYATMSGTGLHGVDMLWLWNR